MRTSVPEPDRRRAQVPEPRGRQLAFRVLPIVAVGTLLQDVRYGIRVLRKGPGFTAVAVLTLGLGIGAASAVFTWIDAVLLRPFPGAEHANELLALETLASNGEFLTTSYADYRDYRDQAKLIAGLAAEQPGLLNLGDDQRAELTWAELVSGNYFAVMGVKPALGCVFAPEEYGDTPGGYPVAVIGHGLWKRRFHSDPAVVGRTIRLNRREFTIVGVAASGFRGSRAILATEVWVPLVMQNQLTGAGDWPLQDRKVRTLRVIAWLKPGVRMEQARAEVQGIARGLARAYPGSNEAIGATLLPMPESHFGAQHILAAPLRILMAVCGVVLLIVCSNVANLLLARATARQKEFGIRLALGAGRLRLLRQLLTENALVAAGGAALGLVLAQWMSGALRLLAPASNYPLTLDMRMDGYVLAFTALLSLATAMIFGMAPALQSLRPNLDATLKEGGRGGAAGAKSHRLRGLLVVSQVALALVALIGAGLFVKSFQSARRIDPGFEVDHVLLAGFKLDTSGYTREQGRMFYRRLRERLESVPGIQAVGYSDYVPLGFDAGSWEDLQIEGYVPGLSENMKIYRNVVAPGYFDLMKIPLVVGRDFAERDDEKSLPVTIVSQAFARRFLPGRNPIGYRVRGWGRWFTIVGVARDIRYHGFAEGPMPFFYVPFLQIYRPDVPITVYIRTARAPDSVLGMLRREARALDAGIAIAGVMPLTEHIGQSLFAQKMAASLLGALGSLALLLAAVGLYSLMAYSVSQRTQEIGIRMALGARPADVRRMVVGQGMALTLAGVVLGLGAALALTRLIAPILLTVSPTDPAVFLGAAAFLAAIALAASYLPARRATKVDPMIALRCQ